MGVEISHKAKWPDLGFFALIFRGGQLAPSKFHGTAVSVPFPVCRSSLDRRTALDTEATKNEERQDIRTKHGKRAVKGNHQLEKKKR